MSYENTRDDKLDAAITSDVMAVLAKVAFFEQLDDLLYPRDPAQQSQTCDGTYALTAQLLTNLGFPSEAKDDVIAVLASQGGGCDCEVLFNVAPESRFRSRYWQNRAAEFHRGLHR